MSHPTGPVWPAFLPNQIIVGNPKSNVAVICGWTTRELMKQRLEAIDPDIMQKIAGIGQLYTAERGVDMLIRNLLANPRIDTVIFCGKDVSGASKEAMHFLNDDRKLEQRETSSGQKYVATDDGDRVRVWGNIPEKAIYWVRERVEWIHPLTELFEPVPLALVVELINDRFNKRTRLAQAMDEPQIYEPPRPDVQIFPAPDSVQVLRAKTVADGWLELLHYIMTYGKRVPTHYDQDTLEIMNLVMVITDQNPNFGESDYPEFMPFTYDHVEAYIEALVSPEKKEDLTYTYGNLMRSHFGVDQFLTTAKKLAKDRGTRSAVISLWDPNNPMKGSPCLNHIWFRIIEGKLNMTATIRSNDMFQGWPENAYGLRAMQAVMALMVIVREGEFQSPTGGRHELPLGDLVIVSQSAHIYEDCWQPAKEIVGKHRKYREWWDEKGQWVFEQGSTDGQVNALLQSPDGEIVAEFRGTPHKIRREIARRGLISDMGHALYVGQMLEKTANLPPQIEFADDDD